LNKWNSENPYNKIKNYIEELLEFSPLLMNIFSSKVWPCKIPFSSLLTCFASFLIWVCYCLFYTFLGGWMWDFNTWTHPINIMHTQWHKYMLSKLITISKTYFFHMPNTNSFKPTLLNFNTSKKENQTQIIFKAYLSTDNYWL
jgi:hypothetical protein